MFDSLTERFNSIFRSLSGRGKIAEENIRDAMRDVRTALLEADVELSVVSDFCKAVQEKALGVEVISSLQPGQLMVKIVYDELVNLMGPVDTKIYTVSPGPTVIMMCGLQGSGKTTTCGKLARLLVSKGHRPLLAAVDLQRPAAVEQLRVLGRQTDVPVYADDTKIAEHGKVTRGAAVSVARAAIAKAKADGRDIVILDTAGRLAIDEELMSELKDVRDAANPQQIFLVLDSMTGQDAVASAKAFNARLELDGLILTKLDSDTRGGALLSAKVITGKPVKFLGTGEKLERLDEFRPEGMAQRILGMGDVVGLVNEAMDKFDKEETERLTAKMAKGSFTLDDFMAQMDQVKKLGPMGKILGMLPGMSGLTKQLGVNEGHMEGQMTRMRAIYDSMTKAERAKPDLLDGSRRRRVSRGSGVHLNEIGAFVKQFENARDMMRAMSSGGMASKMSMMKGLMSGNLGGKTNPGSGLLRTKKSGWQAPKDRNKKKRR